MAVELGLIEGFYGRPWSWEERADAVAFLAPHGYRFFLYAPKGDPYLRRRWQEDHPEPLAYALRELASFCSDAGVRFGVGLSPYELYRDFNANAREALGRKIDFFAAIGVEDLAILFDDMRGDTPDLAEGQIQIVDWIASRTNATRLMVCPSYYTDDPVLDRVFGARPEGYLERLAAGLDEAVEIFWTGEEVCSRELSPGHLDRVAEQIGRLPFLWDNYPVNDGQRMSQYLHLRGFTGRPAENAGRVAGHGINVALQPTLTRIPALTLVDSYRLGDRYAYGEAFHRAARVVMGDDLAARLRDDLLILQDVGLDRLGEKEAALRQRWGGVDHPAAVEIIRWLDGEYRITDEIVHTQ
ncbi:MAG TPA: beta-N-acetylglucosaminidase domain-containing protein [Longimicrobiaceae bacterium]